MKYRQRFFSCLLFSLFFLSNATIFAQIFPFELDITKGCTPFLANRIKQYSGSDNVFYAFQTDEEATTGVEKVFLTAVQSTSHEFKEVGLHWAFQIVGTDEGNITDSISVEVFASPAPIIGYSFCSNRKITFNISDSHYDSLTLDFGDGTQIKVKTGTLLEHQYATAEEQIITLKGEFVEARNTNCGDTAFTITPLESLLATDLDSLVFSENNQIKLQFHLSPYISYFLEEKEGTASFQSLDTILVTQETDTTIILSDKNIENFIYCYRINTYNSCDKVSLYSNELCSSNLSAESQDGFNQLSWQEYGGTSFSEYRIFKDDILTETITNKNNTSWVDNNVDCLVEYCYSLEVISGTTPFYAINNTACATGMSTLAPLSVINPVASLQGDSILVSWENPQNTKIKSITLWKSINGAGFLEIPVSKTPYVDFDVNLKDSLYCYKLQLLDSCNNVSEESDITCPVQLKATKQETSTLLEWTAYQGFRDFSYTLEQLDIESEVVREITILDNQTFSFEHLASDFDRGQMIYRIKTTNTDFPTLFSYSNIFTISSEAEIQVPNAFSPNDDGLNDTFDVSIRLLKEFEIQIFNRWGNPIFTSKNANKSWDGNVSGKQAMEGTYTFVVRGKDELGRVFQEKGVLLLIR